MEQNISELNILSSLKYKQLCSFLTEKYGPVQGDYFINENCKTPNSSIKRSKEGLYIHHVFENKFIQLSYPEYAVRAPYEYQRASNLVYCNIIEHMLLHICIVKEFMTLKYAEKTQMAVGIGGLYNFIIPQIVDYYNGYNYKKDYLKISMSVLDGKEEFIMSQIKRLLDIISLNEGKIMIVYKLFDIHFRTTIVEGKMTKGSFKQRYFEYIKIS